MKKHFQLLFVLGIFGLLHSAVRAENPDTPLAPAEHQPPPLPPWLNDPGRPHGGQPYLQRWMQTVKEKNPQEFERLRTLRKEHPEAFRNELRNRVQNKGREHREGVKGPRMGRHPGSEKLKALENKNRSLAKQAMKAEGDEREQVITQLRQSLGESFDEREAIRMNHLRQARQELDRHQEMAAQRQRNRDQIIREQLEWMINPQKPPQHPHPSKP